MDDRVMQFRVGVMVLATLLIVGILLMLFGRSFERFQSSYKLYVKFAEAPGVTKGTPVRKSGIRIGEVSDVRLSDVDRQVLVTLDIFKQHQIYGDEDCMVMMSLVGDSALEFVRTTARKEMCNRAVRSATRRSSSAFNCRISFSTRLRSVMSSTTAM